MCQVGCIINMHHLSSLSRSKDQQAERVRQRLLPLGQGDNPGWGQAQFGLALHGDRVLCCKCCEQGRMEHRGFRESSKAGCYRSFRAASTQEKDHSPFPWLCNAAVSKAGPC